MQLHRTTIAVLPLLLSFSLQGIAQTNAPAEAGSDSGKAAVTAGDDQGAQPATSQQRPSQSPVVFGEAEPGVFDPQVVRFTLGLGLTFGGDKLAEVEYTDGSDEDIRAGNLLFFSLGALVRPANSQAEFLFTAGYHFDNTDAENGDISFNRKPIEALAFYRINDHHRIGGGLTRHTSTQFEVDVGADDFTIDYKDATGLVLQYDYLPTIHGSLGVRLVSIDYDPEDKYFITSTGLYRADSISGNHIGFVGNVYF